MISFVKKEKQGARGALDSCDVSVTYSFPHGRDERKYPKKTLRFSFSQKAARMICGETEYAVVGIDKDFPDRIYFCSADEKNGYKLSKADKSGTRCHCTFGNGADYPDAVHFVGYYNLEYDAKQGALYINRKAKKGL